MKINKSSPFKWTGLRSAALLLVFSTLCNLASEAQPGVRQDRTNRCEGGNRISREPSMRQRDAGSYSSQQPGNINSDRFDKRAQSDRNVTDNINLGNIDRTPAFRGNDSRRYQGYNNNNNNDRRAYGYSRSGSSINRNNYNKPGYGYGGYNRHSPYSGYNNYRKPVYSAYNPSWRYAHMPRRNSYFNSLPSTYLNLHFGGFNYRYYDGIYYRPYNNIFRVVAPPVGLFINALPTGYRRIYVNDYPYYYYNGTYYDHSDNNYRVVSPPVSAVVESLPEGYEKVTMNGETYYTVDDAQYKPVIQENGEIWYEVIKSN